MAEYLSGGEQTTINSTITELFPTLWFNCNDRAPTSTEQLSEFIKSIDLDKNISAKKSFVNDSNRNDAKRFIVEAYSKIRPIMLNEKLDNALGITKYLYELNDSSAIKQVVWGYREKPEKIPNNHAGDIFVFFKNDSIVGISLKAGGKKTSEPKLNSYVGTTLRKPYWKSLDSQIDSKLKKRLWKEVYSKIPSLPKEITADNYYTTSGDRSSINKTLERKLIDFFLVDPKSFDFLYQVQNKVCRETLCDLINSSFDTTRQWIYEEFRLEKKGEEIPLVLVKAVGKQASEQGDKLAVFLPKATKFHAYLKPNSVQEWYIDVMDNDNNKLTLEMTIRSDSEFRPSKPKGKLGKLTQLKLLYRGVKK